MKKYLFLIPVIAILLVGCGKEETKGVVSCTLKSNDVINGYSMDSKYTINYVGDIVDNVETVETVTSENQTFLETVKTSAEDTYNKMNAAYGGYTYSVSLNGNTVVSSAKIDYNVMNVSKFVEDQPTLKSYSKDGKLTVEGVKSLYSALGATCE